MGEEMVFRPLEREGYTNYRLHIVSDSMMGLDYRKDFRLYLWPRGVENDGKGADDYYDSDEDIDSDSEDEEEDRNKKGGKGSGKKEFKRDLSDDESDYTSSDEE